MLSVLNAVLIERLTQELSVQTALADPAGLPDNTRATCQSNSNLNAIVTSSLLSGLPDQKGCRGGNG